MNNRKNTGAVAFSLVTLLIGAVLMALWWARPLEVTVSGALSSDDVSSISRAVQREVRKGQGLKEDVGPLDDLGHRISNLIDSARGLSKSRLAVDLEAQPDGTVLATGLLLCGPTCGGGATYRFIRGAGGGWEILRVESVIYF